MDSKVYRRELGHSEGSRHFIIITKAYLSMFPPPLEWFTLRVKGKEFQVRIDKLNRIWSGTFSQLINMEENKVVEISKIANNIYSLKSTE